MGTQSNSSESACHPSRRPRSIPGSFNLPIWSEFLEPVEHSEVSAEIEAELSGSDAHEARPSARFWLMLLGATAAHTALIWVLDAIPVHNNEHVTLRWLRALAEHPVRGPLGLALAAVGALKFVRAALNRSPPA